MDDFSVVVGEVDNLLFYVLDGIDFQMVLMVFLDEMEIDIFVMVIYQ